MQDRPTSIELVEAVHEFLEHDVWPSLEGRAAFHMRVTLNVLDIVRRELELGSGHDAAQRTRLIELLGAAGHGDGDAATVDLERDLVRQIRSDTIDEHAALHHIRETVREKLLVSNPKYL